MPLVVKAITQEISQRYNYLPAAGIDSLYFGGGTPSILPDEHLADLLSAINRHFRLNPDAEITLEANPDDITIESLRLWKSLGINRLSIGLQSFNDRELAWMNRAHNSIQSQASVKLAQDMGFDNITIDLIYGSKFQDDDSWQRTLEQAVALRTQHISAYNLTVEQKTALGTRVRKKQEPDVDEDLSGRQFLTMNEHLKKAGFIQYEISNFGRPGYFAKHNTNYWLQQPYLGVGPSAHSFNGVSRQWNIRNNTQYAKLVESGGKYFDIEELSTADRYNEYVMTRLRTIWGCDLPQMKTDFGSELVSHFLEGVKQQQRYFDRNGDVFILNQEGKLRADGIASSLFFA